MNHASMKNGPRGGRRYRRDPFAGGPGHHHGRRGGGRGGRGRGDARAAVLLLLAEEPRHGYEVIQEITARSGGVWTPSPGSVYPALQALEDEGLVTIEATEGRRVASLTDAGREHVEEHRDRMGLPWEDAGSRGGPAVGLRHDARGVAEAAVQVAKAGTPAQVEAASALLAETRRALYGLLAQEAPEGD